MTGLFWMAVFSPEKNASAPPLEAILIQEHVDTSAIVRENFSSA